MARRNTIGRNPLDALVPAEMAPRGSEKAPDRAERVTVGVPPETAERARQAVYFTPGETMSRLITAAIEAEVKRREKARGEPFPARRAPIRKGRPIKA